jgi:sulfite reductase (NADPH) flavoprotein alpha-component
MSLSPPPIGFDTDLLQKIAEHNSLQQMWLSGYLYGIAQQGASLPPAPKTVLPPTADTTLVTVPERPGITILFGSHTGNSKKLANQTAQRLGTAGWQVKVEDMNDYPTKNLKNEQIVLLISSTQGEGEPPVAAEEFYKWLNSPRAPRLEQLQFAVCGLGDRSYLQFCQTGKDFDARLEALGAKRLVARADCDVDYEDTANEWIEAVLVHLPVPVAAPRAASVTPTALSGNRTAEPQLETIATIGTRKQPFEATILEKTQLNGRGSEKETWHLELSLEGSGIQYEAGDALGIYAQNPPSLVKEILYAAMLDGNKQVVFNGKTNTFRDTLLQEVEITTLNREVVENYANWTNNAKLKAILSDNDQLRAFLYGRNLADLIREFPAAMSENTLLSFLRKMPPRLYSIASSLLAHPEEVHLTVGAVRYQHNGRPHLGAASTFLADRVSVGETVSVFVEQNAYFKLPTDDKADIIMVGPGTGIAPFRAFVEERVERGASGRNWLFFGNPHFETDFLYQTEWLNHLKRGSLDRLDVAFSRDQQEKVYVQHRLLERSKLVFDRLENGGYFYICGDKNRMAHDVQSALVQIIATESGKGSDFALDYLKDLKKQRRFLEDIY